MLLNATQTEQNTFSNLALQSLYTAGTFLWSRNFTETTGVKAKRTLICAKQL